MTRNPTLPGGTPMTIVVKSEPDPFPFSGPLARVHRFRITIGPDGTPRGMILPA